MTTVAFDTLAYSNNLQKAGVPREQADAMAQANADAFAAMVNAQQQAAKELVTKSDLAETKYDILRWLVTAMLAQTALLVGILAFRK